MDSAPQDPQRTPRRGLPFVALGGLAALAAGLGVAWMLTSGDRTPEAPPPASEGGLVIDATGEDAGAIDPGKPLRCFVQGQFVGELSLTACAQRNGVATDALDVGLDEMGALTAAQEAGQILTPLPPVEPDPPVTVESALPPAEGAGPPSGMGPGVTALGSCWRHGGGRWRRVATDTDLGSCVQQLFSGRCERPGGATYGRFGQQTLRLVAGRVEVSDDNRVFRMLVPQAPDCSIPPV
ncbi:hypothetical protein [Phenylobacterium sp. SCN 70-31]|uniref:hypothetical protein n=1 Tax=Phenylobacterium sp. SCN 70-31 TaxID=1660129 RepID=UPI000869175E|nr:hypothetical protein [Phenylobacterium sp. SCN 70-31]ODT87497.1 MAG: hypothetical protein ABS78_11540 [Phenylobacterium sp. SCN 70-31]